MNHAQHYHISRKIQEWWYQNCFQKLVKKGYSLYFQRKKILPHRNMHGWYEIRNIFANIPSITICYDRWQIFGFLLITGYENNECTQVLWLQHLPINNKVQIRKTSYNVVAKVCTSFHAIFVVARTYILPVAVVAIEYWYIKTHPRLQRWKTKRLLFS